MLHVYLCDDNPVILEAYASTLRSIASAYNFEINIMSFQSGAQLLFYYEEAADQPDIIFLDIIMKGENGLDTAKKLREMNCFSELIFLTGNPEYVFDSFEVSPSNYIVKNQISDKKFEEIFLKAASIANKKTKSLFHCENGSVRKSIFISSISHFEINNRIVTVHYDKTTFEFYSTLDEIEKKLNQPSFLRVHRSFLVNMHYIEDMKRNEIELKNGIMVPVGVTYAKKVKENLNHYFRLFH